METRFMFPASRSQQVMNTEYAFCNAAMGVRHKKKQKGRKAWSIMQRAWVWNKAGAEVKVGVNVSQFNLVVLSLSAIQEQF